MDVAIVGLGLHPFGRTATMSGLEQGAAAVRTALADAGTDFKTMQFAFGGSTSVYLLPAAMHCEASVRVGQTLYTRQTPLASCTCT